LERGWLVGGWTFEWMRGKVEGKWVDVSVRV